MDEQLIRMWNQFVNDDDLIICGGDSHNFKPISYQEVKEQITIQNLNKLRNAK
jgi:hypothetical protein